MKLTTERIDKNMEDLEREYAAKKKTYTFIKAEALRVAAIVEPILTHYKIELREDFTGGQVYFSCCGYDTADFTGAVISYGFKTNIKAHQTIAAINKKLKALIGKGHCSEYGLNIDIKKEA